MEHEDLDTDETRALRPARRQRQGLSHLETTTNDTDNFENRNLHDGSNTQGGGGGGSNYQDYDTEKNPSFRTAARIVTEMFEGYESGEDEDRGVRVNDEDNDLFANDDVYDDSPYLDRDKTWEAARRRKLSKREKTRGKNSFLIAIALIFVVIGLVVYSGVLVPSETDKIDYLLRHGFGVSTLPKPLEKNVIDWSVMIPSATLESREANLVRLQTLERVTPVFWNIPLSGGDLLENQVTQCLHLVQASDMGSYASEDVQSDELRIVQVFGDSYVNVDTTTRSGLQRSKNLRLGESGLADVIFSPMVYESAALFSEENQATMFTIIRHPVERAVSMYYYLQNAKWDPTYNPVIETLSLEEYANSEYVENNWLTRILSNQPGGTLTDDHVNTAKEILRRKFYVGLFHAMKPSTRGFNRRFGWTSASSPKEEQDMCVNRVLNQAKNYDHPKVEEGSKVWKLLLRENQFDLELFEFAEHLFTHQNSML